MYATNVRNLKKNPSLALRHAEESPVLVLKGNEPNAVILHLDKSLIETERSLRPALAATLYKDGSLSLGAAAKLSALPLTEFVRHLAGLGIEIVKQDETTGQEVKDLGKWLALS
jgi:predicted HTH domain antitoxin